jgi:hypothetical protein
MPSALAVIGLFEILITSVLLARWLCAEKRVDVGEYFISVFAIALTLIPSLLYFGDKVGFGVGGGSLALCSFFPFAAAVAIAYFRRGGSWLRFDVSSFDLSRLPSFVTLAVVDFILGFVPLILADSYSSSFFFSPTSLGDTAHHFSFVEYLYRYEHLPHSPGDFYPMIHHGIDRSLWNYPQAMHLVMAIFAKATGAASVQMLDSTTLLAGILTSLAVYTIAANYGNSKLAILAGITSFLGVSIGVTQAGSLPTVWGILFVVLLVLFMQSYEKRPIFRKLPLVMFSIIGLALYYSFYAPMVLIFVILTMFIVSRGRQAIAVTFAAFCALVGGFAVYAIFQGQSEGPNSMLSYVTDLLGSVVGLYSALLSDPAMTGFLLLTGGIIIVCVTRLLADRSRPNIVLAACTFCITILAVRPFLAILFYNPRVLSCIVDCGWYYVGPAYNFGLSFGLTLFIPLAAIILCRLEKSTAILAAALASFAFVYAYFVIPGYLYYLSKYAFLASAIVPVLLVPLVLRARSLVGSLKTLRLRPVRGFSRKAFGLLLISVIACNIVLQGYFVVSEEMVLRPAIYPGEIEAGNWLRSNGDQVLPCRNYEYFMTMNVLRGEMFEVVSEHQFNMNWLPAGWDYPPFPIPYTFNDWLGFARPGDILVGDTSYPNAIPNGLGSLPMGTPVRLGPGYIEILHVSPPVIIVRYLGTSPTAGNFTCTAGWSTTFGHQPIYTTTTNTATTTNTTADIISVRKRN